MIAQSIVQKLLGLMLLQEKQGDDEPEESRVHRESLEQELRKEIRKWGGIEAIDLWLKEHDPGHVTPSGINKLGWEWLKSS